MGKGNTFPYFLIDFMILILGQSSLDFPTEYVHDWLKYFKVECKRINGSDLISHFNFSLSLDFSSKSLHWNSLSFDVSNISAVWIRRWMNFEYFKKIDLSGKIVTDIAQQLHVTDISCKGMEASISMLAILTLEVNEQLEREFRALSHYFFELLKGKPTLGLSYYSGKDPSKATQLLLAQEAGLVVPATIITDSRERLKGFLEKNSKVICKNLSEIGFFHFFNSSSATYTTLLSEDEIEKLPEKFYPSLFQEAIDKEFEIRVFFLDETLYSMAIFSANDKKTEIDFRRYNYSKPNRMVPMLLPASIEQKIREFMHKAKLTTGSLDLIYSTKGEYVFLEVNPGGQFSMVSYPCNYYLEKKVAQHLIKLSQDETRNEA